MLALMMYQDTKVTRKPLNFNNFNNLIILIILIIFKNYHLVLHIFLIVLKSSTTYLFRYLFLVPETWRKKVGRKEAEGKRERNLETLIYRIGN